MAVDKNLFLYDLAVVAIMKNEAPYVKEWLDYHLLAGVQHFYIYDHESTDNFKEVLQPYINAGIVTYIFYPGEIAQFTAYNDATKKYRFFCRYIAFIDADEFIFPQNNKSIVEVTDEILKNNPNAGGLGINWRMYGSNFQEKADYSKGVLERFTRHAENLSVTVKTIANPRKIEVSGGPHYAVYFKNYFEVNENGEIFHGPYNKHSTGDKILVNHYNIKSFEEYKNKVQRGRVDIHENTYKLQNFNHENNEIFDDSILKYRENCLKKRGGVVRNPINYQNLYTALLQNLISTSVKNFSFDSFEGKMETFLTCRKLAEYLRQNFIEESAGNFWEETSLKAINKILQKNVTIADVQLLLSELPEILKLNYSVVKEIRLSCLNIIPQLMNILRLNMDYNTLVDLDFLLDMLKTFDNYNHK